jgi:putative inorganic carbon (HCO3(-)) transporter
VNTLARVKPLSIFGIFLIGENQNLMVETLLPGIFILIALKYWTKNKFQKRFINVLILFVGFILLLTFSRGAWLSLFIVSIVSSFIYFRESVVKFLIPLFLVLILLFPLGLYMINLQTTYSVGTSSNNSRILLSEIAWDGFRENPILGKGTGEFFNVVAQNIRFRTNYGEPVDSHGVLQKILLENGSLGIITFFIFVFAIYRKFFGTLKDRKFISLYLPLIGAVTSVFIFELFNTSYYKGKLWFVVALALVTIKLIEEKKIYAK